MKYDVEIESLPEALIKELSRAKIKNSKIEQLIQNIIKKAGGEVNLDQILITLFKETKQIYKRTQLNMRLYLMCKKGLIKSVKGKKGVYQEGMKE